MPSSTRYAATGYAAIILPLALACGLAVPAGAEERCTGTLCDLYYGGPPPETPPGERQAAPTPLTVPSSGMLGKLFGGAAPAAPGASPSAPTAPAARPLLGVGGGGLIGMARGAPSERCGGTLCDLYYGSPSPEEQRAAQEAGRPAGAAAPPPTQTAADEAAEEPAPAPTRRRAPRAEPETPRCAATVGHDPWSCYR